MLRSAKRESGPRVESVVTSTRPLFSSLLDHCARVCEMPYRGAARRTSPLLIPPGAGGRIGGGVTSFPARVVRLSVSDRPSLRAASRETAVYQYFVLGVSPVSSTRWSSRSTLATLACD